ncbi:MAG: glycosyltransferase family protein [Candidatus Binatia bacterium]
MLTVVYYISGHGFGHAVRSRMLMHSLQQLCPEIVLHVRTTAPSWLFTDLPSAIHYSKQTLDVGAIQQDSLRMDLEATFQACASLYQKIPQLIEQELSFIDQAQARLIVGDVPPLAFAIAGRAALPSVAIANFSWNWIYRAYLEEFPSFLPLIAQMETFYRHASLCLSLPFSADLSIFPKRVSIPLMARVSRLGKRQARDQYDLPAEKKIALLSFGGLGLSQTLPVERDVNYLFVTTGNTPLRRQTLVVLPDEQLHYEDLVRAADVVVTKPGYGIVADAIAHQVPVLYTARGPFPEYDYLVQTLSAWATS